MINSLLLLAMLGAPAGSAAKILAQTERVADYQLSHPSREKTDGWIQGAFYTGLCALDSVSGSRRFREALVRVGERNGWRLGPRVYHADDMCVGQFYLYLYGLDHDPRQLAAMKSRCDWILARPKDDNLAFVGREKNDRWSWCDSLYMAPPAWLELAKITGNPAYRDYAVAHWWKTSAYLYDPENHLFFRDSTYFDRREPNGKKIFWSRGNAWVLASLAHVLELLPAGDPDRPRFEAQFRELSESVRRAQMPDGTWRASLLDPDQPGSDKEASGTGFFCFAFAWGVNHGLLDPAEFGPAARRAWAGLLTCVEPSGRLNHVQPIGNAPTQFSASTTEAYGVGAFLLAGVEMSRLAGGHLAADGAAGAGVGAVK